MKINIITEDNRLDLYVHDESPSHVVGFFSSNPGPLLDLIKRGAARTPGAILQIDGKTVAGPVGDMVEEDLA